MTLRYWLPLALILSLGCSDSTTTTPDGSTGPDSSPDATVDGGGGSGELDVVVLLGGGGDDPPPADGALVTVEAADGTTREMTTGADGRVALTELDLTTGVAITASLGPSRQVQSWVGVTQALLDHLASGGALGDGGELVFSLGELEPTRLTVSGTVTNMADPTHFVIVTASVDGSTSSQETGDAFSLEVPPGSSVSLVAVELFQPETTTVTSPRGTEITIAGWASVDLGVVDADTTATIDFTADALTPTTFSGTFGVDRMLGVEFFEGAAPGIRVNSDDSGRNLLVGFHTTIDWDETSRTFTYSGEQVAPPGGGTATAELGLSESPAFSQILVPSTGLEGAQSGEFLEPPRLETPAFGAPHPLHDMIEWRTSDTGIVHLLQLIDDDTLVWQILGPGEPKTMTVPTAPSNATEAALFDGARFDGRLLACEFAGGRCDRIAVSRAFEIVP